MERESRIIASCFALAAFTVAIVAGLSAGKDALSILIHAIIAMLICQVIGTAAGAVLAHASRLHVEAIKAQSTGPAPGTDATTPAPTDGGGRSV